LLSLQYPAVAQTITRPSGRPSIPFAQKEQPEALQRCPDLPHDIFNAFVSVHITISPDLVCCDFWNSK
jgi:hypothetical protein